MSLIFRTIHGSHLYGLAHENSDLDYYEVYEGKRPSLSQRILEPTGEDLVRGSLEAFVRRAFSGSHQSCEALFSRKKEWAPGMEERWGPFLTGIRVSGEEVVSKYERTIRKFCYGDFKRRRHAVRLRFNLNHIQWYGKFNPTMNKSQIEAANYLASGFEGDELRESLHV